MRRSQQSRLLPTVVGAFPVDESPYGIRDLAGSMCDWCSDVFAETGPPDASARHGAHRGSSSLRGLWTEGASFDADAAGMQTARRVRRGGCWRDPMLCLRAAYRSADVPTYRDSNSGFRLCLLYTSPSPRDYAASRMPSSA